jgi:hypothetical protein
MALVTSGAISFGTTAGAGQTPKRSIYEELGISVTSTRSLGSQDLRGLADKAGTGTISMSDFYGKSAGTTLININTTGTSTSGTSVIRVYGSGYTSASPNPVLSGGTQLGNGDSAKFTITDNSSNIKVLFNATVDVVTSGSFPYLTTYTIRGGTISNIVAPSGASVNSSDNTKLDVPAGTFSYASGTPITTLTFTGSTPSGSTPNFITGSNTVTYTAASGSVPPSSTATEAINLKIDKL